MGAGVEAVKQKLVSSFGCVDFFEMYDRNADSTVLSFETEGERFSVKVSREFDDDFLSGTTVSLRTLIPVLIGSDSRKALVVSTAISGE